MSAAALSWPIVSSDSAEDRFRIYVANHAPAFFVAKFGDRSLDDARRWCEDVHSNVDVRFLRDYVEWLRPAVENPGGHARLDYVAAMIEGAVRELCPPRVHVPIRPKADVIASLPLPRGAVTDSFHTGSATYRFPASITLTEVARFFELRLSVGGDWRGWAWCGSSLDRPTADNSPYTWRRGDRVLDLGWRAEDGELFTLLPVGTAQVSITNSSLSSYESYGPTPCSHVEDADG